jgi:DNA-binding transcriptional regulator YiaG
MKLAEYTSIKAGEGKPLTRTVAELAGLLGVSERTLWRWYEAQNVPRHVELLLQVLVEAAPEQKKRWFGE